jgi:hypothetical protein
MVRCCCNVYTFSGFVCYVLTFWMLWSRCTGRISIVLPRGIPVNFNVVVLLCGVILVLYSYVSRFLK